MKKMGISIALISELVHYTDRSVGIATGYGLDDRSSVPDRGKRFFSTPQRPDRMWG
jgi:hypothetical protein